MKFKEVKEFMKEYKILREELADELSYSKPTMVNILNKKDSAEPRQRLIFYMGMKKIIERRLKKFERALEEWEKKYGE